ncbi:MAG: hypothetical protein ACYC4H_00910 [Desulfocucumaceae bacterium]
MRITYTIIACLIISALILTGCSKDDSAKTSGDNPAPKENSTPKSAAPAPLPSAPPEAAPTQGSRPVTVLATLPELVAAETVEIKGKTRPDSRIFINGQEAKLDPAGEFNFPFSLQVGKNEIKVVTLGKNKVEDTRTLTVERRPVPPKLTVISPDQSDNENLTISGQTEKGCVVYVNSSVTRPDREGNFTAGVQLKEGANKIIITSTNKDGGTVEVQKTVSFKPGSPRLEVIIPDDTRSKQVTISGITDTNTVLLIYVNDIKTEVNMSNGVFSGTLSLEEGVNSITVTAVNKWGKKSSVSKNISYSTL